MPACNIRQEIIFGEPVLELALLEQYAEARPCCGGLVSDKRIEQLVSLYSHILFTALEIAIGVNGYD